MCGRQVFRLDSIGLLNYLSPKLSDMVFFSDYPALCDKAALTHWATQKRMNQSALPALSMREVDLTPAPLFSAACLHDKIGSCGKSSTLKTFFSATLSHCVASALFFFPYRHFYRGNFTVPKLSESNMGFSVLGVFLGLLLEVSTHGPHAMPRTTWRQQGKTGLYMVLGHSYPWINVFTFGLVWQVSRQKTLLLLL